MPHVGLHWADSVFLGLGMIRFIASSRGLSAHKAKILAAATAAMLSTSQAAWATCGTPVQSGFFINNQAPLAVPASAAGAAIASAITNVDTAFLTPQGSAFVSAPADPMPNQPGGGVWARGIGGSANVSTTSNSASTNTRLDTNVVVNNSTVACANNSHEDFAGVQVGADIARLNWNGWNVHLGTSAGYLGSRQTDDNGFNNHFEVPFLGTYIVATHGRFFADLMVREEFYNISLNNSGLNFFSQPVGAHGYSVSTSAGYNFDLGQRWFVEPSGGFVYSRTTVDNFANPATTTLQIPGIIQTPDIESKIGRLSLRVGKTIETPNIIWQPFASASVFHEFAGNVITNYISAPNSALLVIPLSPVAGIIVPQTFAQQTSTSRIGTYGQYSLGVAGQIVNTGWLGFVRVDYRDGSHINGWTGNAGIRYQFTPEMVASVMPVKVKAPPHPVVGPTNWTGFYVGGFAGVDVGRSEIGFVGVPFPAAGSKPWVFGPIGGIEAGYNYEFANNLVLGIDGDFGGTGTHGGQTAGVLNGVGFGTFAPAFLTASDQTNWVGTATGKVGYAWERTLFYAKGGVAVEDSTTTIKCIFGPAGMLAGVGAVSAGCRNQAGLLTGGFTTPTYTRVGWTAGFGTAFDLGHNWSAKTEYDFLSFGRHTALANDGTTFLTDKARGSQVKVGVDYKFALGSAVY
jgi:opacity protein-like surface antigen